MGQSFFYEKQISSGVGSVLNLGGLNYQGNWSVLILRGVKLNYFFACGVGEE